MSGHLVLLGDSIFDNAAYVRGGPAVIDQVRELLPRGWRATLCAVDGSLAEDVPSQLRRVPADATHLVVSAGGNDAAQHMGLLSVPAATVGEAFSLLRRPREDFARSYFALLEGLVETGRAVAVCTIYEPRFPEAAVQVPALVALSLFNDVIVRAARAFGLPVLDLRAICNEDRDFANAIEPSSAGGAKIAAGLLEMALGHDFASRRTVVWPGARS